MHRTIGQFIDGRQVYASGCSTFDSINPANGQLLATVEQASAGQVDDAVLSASAAQREWVKLPVAERTAIMLDAAKLILLRNDELAQLETLDTGKPIFDTSRVDIKGGVAVMRYFAGLMAAIEGRQSPVGETAFTYTRREPLGVVAGVGAWNYPLQIAMWKLAPALAAGNAMVFKPSELTPLSTLRLAELLVEAGVPAGLFNVLQGNQAVGKALSEHPGIAKISFTGSVATGMKVMTSAAGTLKKVTMELGGKSPLIILPDADIERAADIAVMANFFSSGQVCTSGTRVFVHRAIQARLQRAILKRVENIAIGDPSDPRTRFGPLVSQAHREKVLAYIQSGRDAGATLLCGGHLPAGQAFAAGSYLLPTVFTDCSDDMQIVQEEIFGPVMSLLTFDSEQEVIARANASVLGLAGGVVTQNISQAHRIVHALEAGICWVNTWGQVPPQMPGSGSKLSGIGQENGIEALLEHTRTKSVFIELGSYQSVFPPC
ncbi:betaine-aldehyde dehydrogenase [Pseudomonas sp. Marseille-P9655]|uniref:betaine-aldehyde dehydrogenase n=1 Tax=Pseudomonas sp. Marseille-P9655 TaxID=2866591 RepID=UPI001CE41B8B|nr:betaine-aldehyde dehydrogenase [Pseudomonas sp. Marseille-P9655]